MTRRGTLLLVAVATLALLALAGTALAGDAAPALVRQVLGSGGGRMAGGDITVEGTIGQPLVGPAGGGPVALEAGYWQGLPVLSASKSDGLDTWYAGWNYSYTVVVANTGAAAATGLVVTDTLPAEVYALALPAGATRAADGGIVWDLGELGATETVTLTLHVRTLTNARGAVTNRVQVSYDGGPALAASDTTTIVAPPASATPPATATGTATATPTATSTPTATPTSTETPAAAPCGWLPLLVR